MQSDVVEPMHLVQFDDAAHVADVHGNPRYGPKLNEASHVEHCKGPEAVQFPHEAWHWTQSFPEK
jgi:hypothetical protein